MKKYNVIWFDDEFTSLDIIREKAHIQGINLIGFTNSEDGIRELELNISKYDAAIVDGIFFKSKEQTGDVSNDKALRDVASAIAELSFRKRLPWFILSGQTSFTKGENDAASFLKDNKVFDKLNEGDLDNLWNEIKAESDKQPDTQLRHKYAQVFALCNERYLGVELTRVLLDLLKENEVGNGVSENKLNSIRKVVESIFKLFNRIGVIPNEVVSGFGWFTNSNKFLAGSNEYYDFSGEIAPPAIVFLLRSILHVTQDGSHAGDELKLKIDHFVKSQPTGYLFSSVLFQLLEVMIWTKGYIDAHPDIEVNKTIATKKSIQTGINFEGVIQQDSKQNYFCGPYLLLYNYIKDNHKIGDRINILEATKNTNKYSNTIYSKLAIKFTVINN